MEHLQEITILGRDHDARGEVYLQSLDPLPVALGTSAGTIAKPNEDAVGVSVLGKELVLAIADGHWGREAAEIGVSKAMELLCLAGCSLSPKRRPQARLISLFEQVNEQLYDWRPPTPGAATPETTLIVCHIRETEDWKSPVLGKLWGFLSVSASWADAQPAQPPPSPLAGLSFQIIREG